MAMRASSWLFMVVVLSTSSRHSLPSNELSINHEYSQRSLNGRDSSNRLGKSLKLAEENIKVDVIYEYVRGLGIGDIQQAPQHGASSTRGVNRFWAWHEPYQTG